MTRGASPSQCEIPRCVNHRHGLDMLREGTVETFHSTVIAESAEKDVFVAGLKWEWRRGKLRL